MFPRKIRSGLIRISDKNGNIRPDPDSESGKSLVTTWMFFFVQRLYQHLLQLRILLFLRF